jgi:hypothetical protein
LIVAHYEVVGRVFFKSDPSRKRKGRSIELFALASPYASQGLRDRSSLQDETIFNAGSHHFVVGYYQMSRRDEVLSECYLALC